MIRHKPLALAALAAVVLLVGLAAAPAAAQSGGTATATPANATTDTERIDQNTVLVESSFNSDAGTASVTLRSDTLQQITVVDGSYLMTGGEATMRTVMVRPGETTTIDLPAEQVRGHVALSIGTPETLYGEVIEVGQQSIFDGPASWGNVQVAGAAGFTGGLGIVGIIAYRRARGGKEEVTQVV